MHRPACDFGAAKQIAATGERHAPLPPDKTSPETTFDQGPWPIEMTARIVVQPANGRSQSSEL
jgi:hypothetical protein